MLDAPGLIVSGCTISQQQALSCGVRRVHIVDLD